MSAVGRSVEDKGDDKGHSGRLLLRMPRALHAELAREAEQQGISLNQLIVGLLSRSLADGVSSKGPLGADASEAGVAAVAPRPRGLGVALAVNLVVLVLVGVVAVALLIVAWRGGF